MTEFNTSNNLPPKRKSNNPDLGEKRRSGQTSANSEKVDYDPSTLAQGNDSDEIGPEMLLQFEEIAKSTKSYAEVELDFPPNQVTAPILEDYIDPHTVPIHYLLEQARASIKPEEMAQELLDEQSE